MVSVKMPLLKDLLKDPLDFSCLQSVFDKSIQDKATSAFVVGKMQGRDNLSSGMGLAPLSDCPERKKDDGLRGCTFKNTCSLQVIVMLECVQHFGWAQYKVQWFKAGRSGRIQQIQNYLFFRAESLATGYLLQMGLFGGGEEGERVEKGQIDFLKFFN